MSGTPVVRSASAVDAGRVIRGIEVQARVINALMLRETKTRYGNYKIGFLWGLIEPAVSVSIFVAIFSVLRQDQPSGMPLVPFMLVGFVGFSMFKDPWGQMQAAIGHSRQLLAFPQVSTFDVLMAKGLLEVAITLFVFVFLLCMAALLGYEVRVERPLGVLMACALLCTLGLGMGFLFAAVEPIIPSVKQLSGQLMGRPLYFSSGLFFTAEAIPGAVLDYLLWNPVLHMIELLRGEFFHGFETAYGSWLYASGWSFGTLAAGLTVHQALRRRAISTK